MREKYIKNWSKCQLSDKNTPEECKVDSDGEQTALKNSISNWKRDNENLISKNDQSVNEKLNSYRKFAETSLNTCVEKKSTRRFSSTDSAPNRKVGFLDILLSALSSLRQSDDSSASSQSDEEDEEQIICE